MFYGPGCIGLTVVPATPAHVFLVGTIKLGVEHRAVNNNASPDRLNCVSGQLGRQSTCPFTNS